MKKAHLLGILLSAAFALSAAATPDDAEQRLRGAVDSVLREAERMKTPQTLVRALTPVLNDVVNFEAMTRRAVGPGWRQFSPAQRAEATKLFSALIIRTYSERVTPGVKPVVTFQRTRQTAQGRVEIPTVVTYRGNNHPVVYRMEKGTGWQVTDILIEGVSLIANYRGQFDAAFKRGGADAVLQALRDSNAAQSS